MENCTPQVPPQYLVLDVFVHKQIELFILKTVEREWARIITITTSEGAASPRPLTLRIRSVDNHDTVYAKLTISQRLSQNYLYIFVL